MFNRTEQNRTQYTICIGNRCGGAYVEYLFTLYPLVHYLPLDGMINIPTYLVWRCWVQLNSFFADHIIFNNGYMKHAHKRQRMTNDNNNNKSKQV